MRVLSAPGEDLPAAQHAKCDLVARKLGLAPGMRVLDVGCGWGTFAVHAARNYGVHVVGVTLSHEQAEYASKRMVAEGIAERVQIRVQDYRDVDDGPFDAISSIGMAEHVGVALLPTYAAQLSRCCGDRVGCSTMRSRADRADARAFPKRRSSIGMFSPTGNWNRWRR